MADEAQEAERLNALIRHYVNGDECEDSNECEVCIHIGFALDAMGGN